MSSRRLIAEMNVVPYVDVMLVLVVILMVTTPMLTQGVQVDLPKAEAKEIDSKQELPIVVTVAPDGKAYLNISANPSKEIEPVNLQTEVAAALHLSPNRKVLLQGDKHAAYEVIMQVMVLLQNSGVSNIGLQTHDDVSSA